MAVASPNLPGVYTVLDLSINLRSFINIELRSQGWYAVRVRVLPEPRIKAVWLYSVGANLSDAAGETEAPPPGQDHVIEAGWSWRSRVFRIRYCYEEIHLGETPCFQVFLRRPGLGEGEASRSQSVPGAVHHTRVTESGTHPSHLSLEGLDSPPAGSTGGEDAAAGINVELELLFEEADMANPHTTPSVFKLKPVARDVVRLSRVCSGVAAYYPATWGADFFGLCNVVLLSCVTGYTTRPALTALSRAVGRDLRRPRGSLMPWTSPRGAAAHDSPRAQGSDGPGSNYTLSPAPSTQPAALLRKSSNPPPAASTPPRMVASFPHLCGTGNGSGASTPRGHNGPCGPSLWGGDNDPGTPPLASPHSVASSAVGFANLAARAQALGDGSDNSGSRPSPVGGVLGGPSGQGRGSSAGTSLPALMAAWVLEGVPRAEWSRALGSAPSVPLAARLSALFVAYAAPQAASTAHLRRLLRALPASAYHPQSYTVMRELLEQSHVVTSNMGGAIFSGASVTAGTGNHPYTHLAPLSHELLPQASPRGGSSVQQLLHSSGPLAHIPPLARTIGGSSVVGAPPGVEAEVVVADVNTWGSLPTTAALFLDALPPGCSTGAAIAYLCAVLMRMRSAAVTEWSVAQWVMHVTGGELAKWLKCEWEVEQPALSSHWISFNGPAVPGACGTSLGGSAASDMAQELQAAAGAVRRRLRGGMCGGGGGLVVRAPQVHQVSYWSSPWEQPVLLVDDTHAQHLTSGLHRANSRSQASSNGGHAAGGTGRLHTTARGWARSTAGHDCVHAVVFVHGYQGAPTDLGLLKGHMSAAYPYLECLCSKANEVSTAGSLADAGVRLAKEVSEWLAPFTSPGARRPLATLSFVGHSLGCLITRAALASREAAHLLPHLHTFISLCGPHLGSLYSSNGLLEAGAGLLRAFTRSHCLHQLALSDARDVRHTFLYSLATTGTAPGLVPAEGQQSGAGGVGPGHRWSHSGVGVPSGGGALQRFKAVVLVASAQDRYVPLHSARLTPCAAANRDGERGVAWGEMLAATCSGFGTGPDAPQLLRVDVDFAHHKANMLSDAIGRTAHIAFLESDAFARLLVWGVLNKYKLVGPEVAHAWVE